MAAKNITKAKHRFPLRQIRHFPRFFRVHWPTLTIVALALLLAYLNYEPGTFLIGWDNLNPEFATWMNLKRAIFSVWQEYRGLGLLGGQAHSADIPRMLLILLLQTLKFPLSSLRYLTTFLPLVAGPLGVYYLFYHHLFREKLDAKTTQFASFLGAAFYLLNLNTLQTFFVPFETFTWFYGIFPWLLFFIIYYITKPSFKRLSTLFVISLIASPAFYVETIFLVFFVAILPFVIEFFSGKRRLFSSLKTVIAAIFSLIVPHLYWLLPVAFFVLTGGGQVTEGAKINRISSPQTYYRNLEFADIENVALTKGYLFNYLDMGSGFKYDYLLSVWRNHLATPLISLLGVLTVLVILVGLYYSFKKRFAWTASFISVLALCLFFLMGGGLLLNRAVPLLGELFRSPFTKFSVPLSLSFAFFFAIGTIFILDLFTFLHSRLTYILTLFSVTVALLLYMSPAFAGNLISGNMRVAIPTEYFDLFAFFREQDPSARIANFPQYTFWGWNYYDWGYRGSGFLWHGLEQPLLDRAFDVWDRSSERYYEEMSTAIYSDDLPGFEKLIDKYAVSWILLDKHVISPDGKTDLGNERLENFLTSSPKFSFVKSFNERIDIYRTDTGQKIKNFLSVSPPRTTYFPFTDLSLRPTVDWTEKAGHLSIVRPVLPGAGGSAVLKIPSFSDSEKLLPVKIEYQKLGGALIFRLQPVTPVIFADDRQIDLYSVPTYISIPIPPQESFILQTDRQYFIIQLPAELPAVSDFFPVATVYLPAKDRFPVFLYSATQIGNYPLTIPLSQAQPVQCYTDKPNRKIEKIVSPSGISLLGTDVNGCLSVPMPQSSAEDLLSYSFVYSSPNLISGHVNISGRDFNSPEINQPLEPSTTPVKTMRFTHSTGEYQQLNLILDAEDSKSIQEITYRDIVVGVHPRIFASSALLADIPAQDINLETQPSRIQLSFPLTGSQFDIYQTPESNSLLPESRNCDQFNPGKTVKIVSQDGFFYQSQNAIECDSLNLRHFSHALNYLISFSARSEKGLSLTTCLENYSTRRCDVFERLIESNVTQSIIQPIGNPAEDPGYTLHLFNESIGSRISSNLVRSITVRPIPLNFIENISVSNTAAAAPETVSTGSDLFSTHPAEFLYTAAVKSGTPGETLDLYQTRSPYWLALQVSSSDLGLPPRALGPKIFFSFTRLPRLTADNTQRHNSWRLPEGENNLVLVYLPQYLQFIGFAVILLASIALLILSLISTGRKK